MALKYREAVAFLDSLVDYERAVRPRTAFKLDNIRNLLGISGNPQTRLRNTILVAGTKGKGSVCYMLEAALRACGKRSGMFVSPHVTTVRERIQFEGRPVSRQRFANLVSRFAPLVKRQARNTHRVSYFECLTAMAFQAFADAGVDFSIIEVGLGGRLDATNLCEPSVSVVTRIGLDHIQVLGTTVKKIAIEKAGVMRPGRPVVIGQQPPPACHELTRQARRLGAEDFQAGERVRVWDISSSADGITFSVLCDLGAGSFTLPVLGAHQVENCATTLAVLGLLAQQDAEIRFEPVRKGLEWVSIPARCQVVRPEPLLLVDSCHNPDSGQALAQVIRDHLKRKVVLVYGSLRGKLVSKTIAPLSSWVEQAILVQPSSPRALELATLARVFGRQRIPYQKASGVREALRIAAELAAEGKSGPLEGLGAGPAHPVVVAGSFYLAGEVLSILSRDRRRSDFSAP